MQVPLPEDRVLSFLPSSFSIHGGNKPPFLAEVLNNLSASSEVPKSVRMPPVAKVHNFL